MTDKIKKLKKDNISVLAKPLNPPADLMDIREFHEVVHNMKLKADLHTKYMSEEERQHDTTVKPIYDDFLAKSVVNHHH